MAKVIKYKFVSCEVNRGTAENPNMDQIILGKSLVCSTQAEFDAAYPVAEQEAIQSTIEISGEFDPEPSPAGDNAAVWDELDKAYQEGVDSV